MPQAAEILLYIEDNFNQTMQPPLGPDMKNKKVAVNPGK